MNMDFSLIQQQSMKLVMTNELRQAITMLQYSVQDLHEYLQEQQLENPLIELKEPLLEKTTSIEKDFFQTASSEEEVSPLDFLTNKEDGLQDYLLSQLRVQSISKELYETASYIALCTDENGYLTLTAEDFAAELKEPLEMVEAAIEIVQHLEPAGVGAGSLKECLLLQLKYIDLEDPLAEKIVAEHLDLLAKKQFKQIARLEQVEVIDVQHAADFIQTLNPKPGAVFHQEPAEYVTPEVTIEKIEGRWQVSLNNAGLPKMMINRQYEQLLQNNNEEVRHYLKQKQEQFHWIRKSIAQRQVTILKVTEAIAAYQQEFLEKGVEYLKPLTLKVIAEKLEIHESTVSRATTKKYVQTPRGLFELKYFFKSGIQTQSGEEQSADRAKICLKRLIDEEDKSKPLSDQKLMEKLLDEYTIDLKRRTVAKYREEMHIPSSSKRKRYE
ncbi:RNA polymerase factor sigma-54 [Alkalicoccus daliensis]|uniref:RNA polymerase, sigma 54 subunit, RpoN/SigL n=1 Tax=Alkalicoccus daliensis TaxID=745820 RepID=A0A1H0JB23_9BACI|nr:RNA polymerase factor sigma-54 [Alkalicoccus daliensis]SDO40699.1 RNA polymerase, sigma 54 subunit, RpoN/SigL [Alkalicoccus daliensis]